MLRVIIPTLNAAADWPRFAPALLRCVRPNQVLLVDSESNDGTAELGRQAGFEICTIPRAEFNHGGTRQRAANMCPEAKILVYLTQDAILASPDEINKLIAAFDNPEIAVAYGRQLPRPDSSAIEAHARRFNYPALSDLRELSSRDRLGFKTVFVSNSFAAYRRSALMQTGGFPSHVIFGEDTITAARLLLAGHKVAYVAEANVYHSHPYTWRQEFRRYFDIGVLHHREAWLLDTFGGANGEGKRFVISELGYLLRRAPWLIPSALLRTVLKYVGYRQGRMEHRFPLSWTRRMSMHRRFWDEPSASHGSRDSSPDGVQIAERDQV